LEQEHEDTAGGRALLLGQVRELWRWTAAATLAGLLWTLGKVSVPLLIRQAIDRGIDGDDSLVGWSLLILLAGVVAAVFTGVRRYLAFHVARSAETNLRDRLFAHLQRLHFGFHDRAQTGQLMSRANTDLQQVQSFLVMIPLTISNFLTVVLSTIALLYLHAPLAVAALVGLPFVNYLGRRFGTKIGPAVMRVQEESAQLASVVEESVAGVRVVKGFGAEHLQVARLHAEADDVFDASMDTVRIRSTYLPAMELVPNIGLIAVLGYGGHLVIDGQLDIGELVAFNVFVTLLIWPLRMLGMILAQAKRATAAAQRVHAVLVTEPRVVDAPDARPLPVAGSVHGHPGSVHGHPGSVHGRPGSVHGRPGGHVRFEHVSFGYAEGLAHPVLDGLDLEIEAGTSVALVGATGSGKTTLARLIPRFYDVADGRVLLDGADVRDVRLRDLRRAVATVFEDTFLFSDTIGANIAFADPDADPLAVERAARLAGAHEFVVQLPDGYDTEIGERGYSLSGGQRQRIAIARAVLADPRVLILDDATSAVDPTKEHEIRDALEEVMRGRTTIVIAHRPATIALADRVVLIDEGRVEADGTHESLLRESPRYREVLASAAHEVDDSVAVGGGGS
jgi:ATP-binding cassette subfamily B protein